jgi:hypothetical protein
MRFWTLIGAGGEKLHRQVARRGVQLNAVKPRREGVARGGREFGENARNFAQLERARHVVVLHTRRVGPHLAGGAYGRRRDERRGRVPVRGVSDAAHVHELGEHPAALGVHGVGDLLPRGHLFGGLDRGRSRVAKAPSRRRHALGDDDAGGGPLRVVVDRERRRHAASERAAPSHRRHEQTIAGVEAADAARAQKIQIRHGAE